MNVTHIHTLYLVLVQQALVHDVVEVCEEVCVRGNILPPLHDPADQLVGVKLPLLVAFCQHGGLKENAHIYMHMSIRTHMLQVKTEWWSLTYTYLKKPGSEDSQRWDQNRRRGRRLVVQRNAQIISNLKIKCHFYTQSSHNTYRKCLCVSTHLGQVLPQLTQIVKDLSVDLWVFDAIDIPQDTQHPPPHHCGNICVPSG